MTTSKSFNNISEAVIKIVQSLSLSGPTAKITVEQDLFGSGALDSVVLVGLLTQLEEHFKIEVPPTEFTPENFSTVNGMVALVNRLLK